ncbi:YetF domain-containing protein [Jeotgalibacillus sp. JSM ZJ347]|uniref:YetF domain-containing protein n=1 Tax=Jeotgalibacillus sp. JSM ZJ347 TaxID=3342117 RepID=UPI0035A92A7E
MSDWLMVIVRGLLMVMVLFVCTKMLGKKQISQLSFFEYVTGITVGSIGAEVITGLDRQFLHGVLGIVSFISIPLLVDFLSLKSKKVRDLVEGEGTVFIQRGKIIEKNLKKERYTTDELMELLRKKEVFAISDVNFAILEPSGELNVMLKKAKTPLVQEDLNKNVQDEKPPETIIMDGKPIEKSLSSIGRDVEWLKEQMDKKDVNVSDVFLAQITDDGKIFMDLYDRTEDQRELVDLLDQCRKEFLKISKKAGERESLIFHKNAEIIEDCMRMVRIRA